MALLNYGEAVHVSFYYLNLFFFSKGKCGEDFCLEKA